MLWLVSRGGGSDRAKAGFLPSSLLCSPGLRCLKLVLTVPPCSHYPAQGTHEPKSSQDGAPSVEDRQA